jgi:hypothetical protein
MALPGDAEQEIYILREKLDTAEKTIEQLNGAVMLADLKIHAVMKRLLTANDVRGDRAMRVNILEQMNDLQRQVRGFFESAGAKIDANGHQRES